MKGEATQDEVTQGELDLTTPPEGYTEEEWMDLSDAEKEKLAATIKDLQRRFGGGAWITPDPALSAERRNRLATFAKSMGDKGFLKQAEKIAAQKYDDYGFKSEKDAPSGTVVPIAFPLIAGSGTLTTIMSLKANFDEWIILAGIIANLVVIYIVLKSLKWVEKVLGKAGLLAVRKFFGVILLAIAVKIFGSNIAAF